MTTTTENKITVRTNNVPRDVLHPWELTLAELKEFEYLVDDPTNLEQWYNSGASFFRYRDQLYDLGEFSRVIAPNSQRCHSMECDAPAFQGWDGYQSDSYFSGLLVRYSNDFHQVVVGTYYS